MTNVRFPKEKSDGSFCIEIVVTVNTTYPDRLKEDVQRWMDRWTGENEVWVREWSSGQREELHYSDCFAEAPNVVSCIGTELRFRVVGHPQAGKAWKDWLVLRIIKELLAATPELIGFKGMADCA